ncbi:MAG: dehydrogenase [Alphaproteobacteria bacterium]|nr:dehydrogenase [Alphaproteobacteria bacterium]
MAAKLKVGITPGVLDSKGAPIFDPAAFAVLDQAPLEWEHIALDEAEISPDTAAQFDALCVMLGKVTAATLARPDRRLKLIARFGVGYDTIDVPACTRAGVLLTIAPDGVRRPVASSVMALMLALAHKILIKDRITRAGRWGEKLEHIGTGLAGRTLGAIGIGNIGAELFRLVAPFGMRQIAFDPFAAPDLARGLGVTLVDFDTLLRESDFVSVMCPLNDDTRGLIGARELGLMKRSAYLINTARGPIVQEKALVDALVAGRIAGAGLDVFEVEPTPKDNPLLALDNVIVAPHGICFTDECLLGLARSAFGSAAALAHGRVPPYVVNREALAHPAFAHLKP